MVTEWLIINPGEGLSVGAVVSEYRRMRNGWRDDKLDCIKFPSVTQDNSFGFVDCHVLRGCHIIPRFSCGKVYADGHGCAKIREIGTHTMSIGELQFQ